MTSQFIEIACPPENRRVRAHGERRRLGARAASFPQPFEPAGPEETIVKRSCLSRDDRATQMLAGGQTFETRGDRSWLLTMLAIN